MAQGSLENLIDENQSQFLYQNPPRISQMVYYKFSSSKKEFFENLESQRRNSRI